MDETTRQRAKRGSISWRMVLALPGDLADAAKADAQREGISLSEWLRRAARLSLYGRRGPGAGPRRVRTCTAPQSPPNSPEASTGRSRRG